MLKEEQSKAVSSNLDKLNKLNERLGINNDKANIEQLSNHLNEYIDRNVPLMSKYFKFFLTYRLKYIAFDLNEILDKISAKLFEFNKALSEIIMNHKVFCQKTSLPGKFKEDRMAERL